jgi:hypothetical protein
MATAKKQANQEAPSKMRSHPALDSKLLILPLAPRKKSPQPWWLVSCIANLNRNFPENKKAGCE